MVSPFPSFKLRKLYALAALTAAAAAAIAAPRPAHAWGAGGHMMVATIAYDRLNPRAKAEVDRLLKIADPAGEAKISDDTAANFAQASHWADDLRKHPEFDYLKPEHFIDLPFLGDTSGTKLPPVPDDNAVTALKHCVAVLKDNNAKDTDKALALRLLIHFEGDIHQPLHGTSRVTAAHPTGDRGGNDFHIKIATGGPGSSLRNTTLHSYWDGGLGAFPRASFGFAPPPLDAVKTAAAKATTDNPENSLDWRAGTGFPYNFMDWAQESEREAEKTVYAGLAAGTTPSAEYVTRGQTVAYHRVAWAGYRLAALLNDLFPVSDEATK